MTDIETRLGRIEALSDIRQTIYTYAEAGDRHNAPETMQRIFTENAFYEAKGVAAFTGLDAIVAGLEEIGKSQVLWSFHLPGRILIELGSDLQTATANWLVWEPASLMTDGIPKPHWLAGAYDGKFVRIGETWKFSSLILTVRFFTPYDGPWTQVEDDFVYSG